MNTQTGTAGRGRPELEPLTPNGKEQLALEMAAFYVQNAMYGIKQTPPMDTVAARRCFSLHLHLNPYARMSAYLYLGLSFVERPLWCIRMERPELCDSDLYPAFPLPYLQRNTNLILELLFITPLLIDALLQALALGRKTLEAPHARVLLVLLSLTMLDIPYAYLTPNSWIRWAPYLRIGLVACYSSSLWPQLRIIGRMIPQLLSTFALIVIFLCTFAWFGCLLFPLKGAGADGDNEGEVYFHGVAGALWSLLILLTTANFPDVMMPAYTQHRAAFLFFLAFIIIGIYFLMPMTLGVVFSELTKEKERHAKNTQEIQTWNLKQAFQMLDDTNHEAPCYLTMQQVLRLFAELNKYQDIVWIDVDMQMALFDRLDSAHNMTVDEQEFLQLCDVLRQKFDKISRETMFQKHCPKAASWVEFIVLHRAFEIVVDSVLVLNGIAMLVETEDVIEGTTESAWSEVSRSPIFDFLEVFFVAFFTAEVLLKIAVLGGKYWTSFQHKFDFLCTGLSLVATILVQTPLMSGNRLATRLALQLRLLRLLRLLEMVPSFRVVMEAGTATVSSCSGIVQTLLAVMYIFSVTGTLLFGGVINQDPESPTYDAVKNSLFGANSYYPNNFNDLPSGMVCLFEILVVNNWFVITSGFTAASGRWLARTFFITFYIIGVPICLNCVVASIVSTFEVAREEMEAQQTVGQERNAESPARSLQAKE